MSNIGRGRREMTQRKTKGGRERIRQRITHMGKGSAKEGNVIGDPGTKREAETDKRYNKVAML